MDEVYIIKTELGEYILLKNIGGEYEI